MSNLECTSYLESSGRSNTATLLAAFNKINKTSAEQSFGAYRAYVTTLPGGRHGVWWEALSRAVEGKGEQKSGGERKRGVGRLLAGLGPSVRKCQWFFGLGRRELQGWGSSRARAELCSMSLGAWFGLRPRKWTLCADNIVGAAT